MISPSVSRHSARHRCTVPSPRPFLNRTVLLTSLVSGLGTLAAWGGRSQPDDFASLWVAGLLARDGEYDHLYDADPHDFARWVGDAWGSRIMDAGILDTAFFPHPFVHIPVVASVMGELSTVMSFRQATGALLFLSGACLVLLIAAAYTLWFREPVPGPVLLPAAAAATVTAPYQMAVWIGQTTLPVLAGLALGLAVAVRHPVVGGILVGVVGAVKLTPLIVIAPMLFFRTTRRAGVVATVTAVSLGAASVLLAGWGTVTVWIGTLREAGDRGLLTGSNMSLTSGLLRNTPTDSPDSVVQVVPDIPLSVTLVTGGIAVVSVVLVLLAARRHRDLAFEITAVGLFVVGSFASNILWTHYLLIGVLLITGIVRVLGDTGMRRTSRNIVIGCTALSVVLLVPPFTLVESVSASGVRTSAWNGLISIAALQVIFLVVLLWRSRSDARTTGASQQPTLIRVPRPGAVVVPAGRPGLPRTTSRHNKRTS